MDALTDLFKDIKFRERFRGYDPGEVDAYVVEVAKAAAQFQGRLMELQQRAQAAEAMFAGDGVDGDGQQSPLKVLALAQRTADTAVAEARQEATHIVEAARRQAEQALAEAEDRAKTRIAQADSDARSRLQETEYQCSLQQAEAEAERERIVDEARNRAVEVAEAERDRIMAEVNGLESVRIGLRAEVDALQNCRAEHLSTLTGSVTALQTAIDGLFSPHLSVAAPVAAPSVEAVSNSAAAPVAAPSVEAVSNSAAVPPAEPVSSPSPPASPTELVSSPLAALPVDAPVAGPLAETSSAAPAAPASVIPPAGASDDHFDTSEISALVPPAPSTRLVTATDIDMVAAGLNVLDRRQSSSASALLDPEIAGPATMPMSMVADDEDDATESDATESEAPPFLHGEPDDGLLVDQLRQAVADEDPLLGSEEAMVAFFGSDPAAHSKGWFRARR